MLTKKKKNIEERNDSIHVRDLRTLYKVLLPVYQYYLSINTPFNFLNIFY